MCGYYIENKRVADIAASLDIPEGTVMSKLFRARKILREGMNMAREFGKMSYAPENLFFTMNGMDSKNGAPWRYLNRLLDVNIMLAAYELHPPPRSFQLKSESHCRTSRKS